MAALGQPGQGEGPEGQASWRQIQGRDRRSGLFLFGSSEPGHEAQLVCLQVRLGGKAVLLLSGSLSPLGRPEASCCLVAG